MWGISLSIAVWLGTREVGGTLWSAITLLMAPWATALPLAGVAWLGWQLLEPFGKWWDGHITLRSRSHHPRSIDLCNAHQPAADLR